MLKIACFLFPLLFTFACGKGVFQVGRTLGEHNSLTVVAVTSAGVESLLRRGYTLEKVSRDSIRTEWRYIRFYPGSADEIWFRLRISVDLGENSFRIWADCQQQYTRKLRESWHWKRCTNLVILNFLDGSMTGLADNLKRRR